MQFIFMYTLDFIQLTEILITLSFVCRIKSWFKILDHDLYPNQTRKHLINLINQDNKHVKGSYPYFMQGTTVLPW